MAQEDDNILEQRRISIEQRRARIKEMSKQGRHSARAALLTMDSAPEADTAASDAVGTAFSAASLPENPCQTARESLSSLRAEWYMRVKAGDTENSLTPQEIRARVDQVILSLTAQVDQAVRQAESTLFAPAPDVAPASEESPAPAPRRGKRK